MPLPFDGAISKFYKNGAPDEVRKAIKDGDNKDILDPSYPYDRWMKKKEYEEAYDDLQLELAKLQADVRATGKRVVIVFEGRDAAGKGGAINAFRDNLNPRAARVVALAKPTETEAGQWYFQRYVANCRPPARSCCSTARGTTAAWSSMSSASAPRSSATASSGSLPAFEDMLVDEGILLFKSG